MTLAVIRPSGPVVDQVIDLMARLVAQCQADGKNIEGVERSYWLTPVKSDGEETADECIQHLAGEGKVYAFGERTPGRRHIKPGDYICFYSAGKGVVAHTQIASQPEHKKHPRVRHSERYPWVFSVKNVHFT